MDMMNDVVAFVYKWLVAELDPLCFDEDDEDFYDSKAAELASKAWKALAKECYVDEAELSAWLNALS